MENTITTIVAMVLGFVAQTAYLKGNFGARINEGERRLEGLENTVRYKDTCDKTHEALERRQARVETVLNGSLKGAK